VFEQLKVQFLEVLCTHRLEAEKMCGLGALSYSLEFRFHFKFKFEFKFKFK